MLGIGQLGVAGIEAEQFGVEELGLVGPIIERAPGLYPADLDVPVKLLDGESADILNDVRETIPDADQWLDTPNTRLWYKRPRELIGTPGERQTDH